MVIPPCPTCPTCPSFSGAPSSPATPSVVDTRDGVSSVPCVAACISICVALLCLLACERCRTGGPAAELDVGSGPEIEQVAFHQRLVFDQLSGVEEGLELGQF